MKRRVALAALIGIALTGAASAPAAADYWGCVAADDVNLGLCLRDPVPQPLPLPDPASLPTAPTPV